MTTEWPFAERYKEYMMPPTQVREALKRLAKKNVDPATDTEENLHVIKAVHQAYANKKERARAASAKSRATKRVDDCGDAVEDAAVACEPNTCDAAVECVAEAVSEPTQATPEAVAAPTPAVAAKKKSVARADNVAVEPTCVAPACVAPTQAQRQARVVEAAPRRGLCAMVASASM